MSIMHSGEGLVWGLLGRINYCSMVPNLSWTCAFDTIGKINLYRYKSKVVSTSKVRVPVKFIPGPHNDPFIDYFVIAETREQRRGF